MKAIVAVDRYWGIGKNGKLLTHIPADLRYFKEKTLNKAVIMGRKTFESLPGQLPLPQRLNIVLTRDPSWNPDGVKVFHTKEEILDYVKNMRPEDVFVIGGGEIYRLFLPETEEILVTRIDYQYACDTYFPNLDDMPEWERAERSEEQTYFDICFTWDIYRRKQGV